MTIEKYLKSCPNCGRHSSGRYTKCIACSEDLLNIYWVKKNVDDTIQRLDKADSEIFN